MPLRGNGAVADGASVAGCGETLRSQASTPSSALCKTELSLSGSGGGRARDQVAAARWGGGGIVDRGQVAGQLRGR